MPQPDYSNLMQHPILTMPQPAGEIMLMAIAVVMAALFLWAIVSYRANGGIFLLTLTAALASCMMEAGAENIAMNYHPEIGGHIAYEAWGMPVPIHIVLSYVLYFGGPGYWLLRRIQRGSTLASWWKVFAIICVVVALADLNSLSSDVWMYYGHQPFVVFKFPLTWMFCNTASMFAFAVIVHLCLTHLKGAQRLFTILIAPVGLAMAWAGVSLPIGNALHSDSGPVLTGVAACTTIAICLFMADLSIRYFRSVVGVQVIPQTVITERAR